VYKEKDQMNNQLLSNLAAEARSTNYVADSISSVTVDEAKAQVFTPVVNISVPYEELKVIKCGDRSNTTRHIPALASKLVYVGSIFKSRQVDSFATDASSTLAHVYGYRAEFDTEQGEFKKDENGELIYEQDEVELCTFRVMFDVNRNTPQFARSKKKQINLIPAQGVPRKVVASRQDDQRQLKAPDWNQIPGLQRDIESPIVAAGISVPKNDKGGFDFERVDFETCDPMVKFLALIREVEDKETDGGSAGDLKEKLQRATSGVKDVMSQ
jgi:hypothetical protein